MSCCTVSQIQNTGSSPVPFCGVETAKLFFTPTYASDGTKNRITLASLTAGSGSANETYIKTLINQADKSKRLYPTDKIFTAEEPMIEAIKEQGQSQHNYFVKDGIRTAKYHFSGINHKYYGILKSLNCVDLSFYTCDAVGNIYGNISSDGLYLEPFKVEKGTLTVDWTAHAGTTQTKGVVSFELSQFEKVENTRMILASELGFSALSLNGLYNVYLQPATAISTTGFKVKLNSDFATALTNIRWENQPKTAFTVYNTTTSASVVVADAVDANSDGEHEISFVAQTSADVLRVTFAKEGFETSAPILVTIP